MCMQDLIISRAVTWRRVTNLQSPAAFVTVIPPNPNRVAIAVSETFTPGAILIYLGLTGTGPPINSYKDAGSFTQPDRSVVTVAEFPGLGDAPLSVATGANFLVVWEAVIDTPLGTAVQKGYEELVGR